MDIKDYNTMNKDMNSYEACANYSIKSECERFEKFVKNCRIFIYRRTIISNEIDFTIDENVTFDTEYKNSVTLISDLNSTTVKRCSFKKYFENNGVIESINVVDSILESDIEIAKELVKEIFESINDTPKEKTIVPIETVHKIIIPNNINKSKIYGKNSIERIKSRIYR